MAELSNHSADAAGMVFAGELLRRAKQSCIEQWVAPESAGVMYGPTRFPYPRVDRTMISFGNPAGNVCRRNNYLYACSQGEKWPRAIDFDPVKFSRGEQ